MESSKPTLIFVHGAFHGPEGFEEVVSLLQKAGHKCINDIHLPGTGGPPHISLEDDVKTVRDRILCVLEEDMNDCILVCHSYGAVVGAQATKGLGNNDRNGKSSVVRMVYLAPNLPKEGESHLDQLLGYMKQNEVEAPPLVDIQNGLMVFIGHEDIFYNDLSPEIKKFLMGELKTQSPGTLTTPITHAGWQHVPGWFLLGAQDNALVPKFEEYIISLPGKMAEVVEWIEAGHSMFMSQPKKVADFISRAAEGRR